jgi:phage tail sheath gpL-like
MKSPTWVYFKYIGKNTYHSVDQVWADRADYYRRTNVPRHAVELPGVWAAVRELACASDLAEDPIEIILLR